MQIHIIETREARAQAQILKVGLLAWIRARLISAALDCPAFLASSYVLVLSWVRHSSIQFFTMHDIPIGFWRLELKTRRMCASGGHGSELIGIQTYTE